MPTTAEFQLWVEHEKKKILRAAYDYATIEALGRFTDEEGIDNVCGNCQNQKDIRLHIIKHAAKDWLDLHSRMLVDLEVPDGS
jgi:hypothetical protein